MTASTILKMFLTVAICSGAEHASAQATAPATRKTEELRLAGSDMETLGRSLERVAEGMPEASRAAFRDAVGFLVFEQRLQHPPGKARWEDFEAGVATALAGKSWPEAIAAADRLRAEKPEAAKAYKAEQTRVVYLQSAALLTGCQVQIALYRLQHGGAGPDFERFPDWSQLTSKTTEKGEIDPAGRFGPYLQDVPVNLMRGASRVLARGPKEATAPIKQPEIGWVFSGDGTLYAVDVEGDLIGADELQRRGQPAANGQ